MDIVIDDLAHSLVASLGSDPTSGRLLVGISGFPASGKSTIARAIAKRVNTLAGADIAVVVGLDGWHFSRAHLDTMPDPVLAHARRGAHWTFDGNGFVSFVRAVRDKPHATCRAPSFDHALKDPVAEDVEVQPEHRIVLFEGLYTFLDINPWREAGLLMHERWYIQVDEDEAARRLVRRHVQSGITPDAATALQRAIENDLPNGRFVREHLLAPTRTITSVMDAGLEI
ncbi:P-loop containing nucleoside triphosphate hydrolase protein [Exidia glandulosa HHB12029]|uniref:p-loop containing nucleoside triphosphate hydrolase protein n=1 Tax=Exidia glandulosa HHB12029 TaxID=1314781 RepID=A0A165LCJ1_EXIGL|nr:P-loop containing nucleoside triphosphate hydrolase protein [Exidia glandulosa HHB12029]